MRTVELETTQYFNFTSRGFADGVPATLNGGAISVKEEGNATPITAGITLTADAASVTGLNEVSIAATTANGYEIDKHYAVYISAGTIGGTSAVGEVVAEFEVGSLWLDQQAIRDAMQLAPTSYTPQSNSVDLKLDNASTLTATDVVSDGNPITTSGGVVVNVAQVDTRVTADVTAWQGSNLLLPSMVEDSGAGSRWTTKALEQAPTGSGSGLTAQETRDAMKLAPTAGAPAAGSIDAELESIYTDTQRVDALIEDVNGDQYTSKALSQAPTGTGSTRVFVQGFTNGTDDRSFTATDANLAHMAANMQAFYTNGSTSPTTAVVDDVGVDVVAGCNTALVNNKLNQWFVTALDQNGLTAGCAYAISHTRTGDPTAYDANTMSRQAFVENASSTTDIANEVDTVLTASHGGGDWITATGFSTHTAQEAANATDSLQITTHGGGSWTAQTVIDWGQAGPWTTGSPASASSSIKLITPLNWDIPDSGTTSFTVILNVLDATQVPVNADTTPTITVTDFAGNSLDANWAGAITNPATGTYERVYNVASTHPQTDVIFRAAGDISGQARTSTSITDIRTPIDISLIALEATSQEILTQTTRVDGLIENVNGDRYTAKSLEQAPAGGGGGNGYTLGFQDTMGRQYAFQSDPAMWFGRNFESFFANNGNQTAKIVDDVGTCSGIEPPSGMAYTTRAYIEGRFGQDNVTKWADLDNAGNAGAITARIEQEIEFCSRMIDGYIQGRDYYYETPFDPVPTIITDIATSLAGYRLWKARGIEAENDVVQNSYDDAMNQMRLVVQRAIKLTGNKAKEGPATNL